MVIGVESQADPHVKGKKITTTLITANAPTIHHLTDGTPDMTVLY